MLTIDLERLKLEDGNRVLDLGCGRGRHTHALYWQDTPLHVTGLDLSETDIMATANGFFDLPPPPASPDRSGTLAAGDAHRLPFRSESFDAVICSEVLEHVGNPDRVIREIDRITKPGGRVALSVPRYWPEWICWKLSEGYRNTPGGHVRIFRHDQLHAAALRAGLRKTGHHWAHALHSPYWWLQCALWDIREDHGLIRAYRRFLEWDLLKAPPLTRGLETMLNPVMGKSLVMYFVKPV
ncbi:methyltransferase domain-containing protein [Hyphobacterium sp. HN65]|uniref:Methyltransferase domain-containing protein n=1 Tax=Hyphobacterium lacteum TaxID=3116575 RepID=A0ABU7LSE4_9PROT|nr:methyltransferase domain-containing protein [Hyphobacterium sp. HN65]MEE2526259.1 methyltransferase domain-containing protein [Hyphobacterium sp. HN65]